ICDSCSSGQRFAFGFLPTSPHDDAVAVRLTLPPDGRVEDLHLQAGAPCRAHQKKALSFSTGPAGLMPNLFGKDKMEYNNPLV
ncbi:MAG: hypothetical protein PVF92_05935, partial [Desulfobacterales bacterium]